MKKYFYLKNGQQTGPFSYDELWNQKIASETMVWYEGMSEWKPASTFPEFGNWFTQTPVPPTQRIARPRAQQSQQAQQQRQVQQRPQQAYRPKPVKEKKSYRAIIGVSIFLIGCAIIYWYWADSTGNKPDGVQKVASMNKSTSQKKSKSSAKKNIQFQVPDYASDINLSTENYPLKPDLLGNRIAEFVGIARTSSKDAQLLFMYPQAEDRYQFILDTYSETGLKVFLQGVVPSIKYQSLTSALVIFYNPWNDLVLITDWHLFGDQVFINDLELVSADYLKYDGQNLGQLAPLWARDVEALPIEALTNQAEEREELFNDIWGELTGIGTWRKMLYSLSSIEMLLTNQPIVAYRLRDQYLNLRYLLKGDDMKILVKPFVSDMKKLHTQDGISELLKSGPNTPGIVEKNMAKLPPNTWEKASVQTIQKVPEGAFIFVTSPRLTKTFLSFFYKFTADDELSLNRIDWCTFDNEL